jgi:uncharacterized repeat protein (TIGR03847 family)
MPRIIYRHDSPDRFIVSAIGEPGQREFFLQVVSNQGVNTIAVEKEQVRALAEQLLLLISEVRRGGLVSKLDSSVPAKIDKDPMQIPIEPDFQLGIANIAWSNGKIEITFQAISSEDEVLLDNLDSGPDLIIVSASIEIVKGFCIRADQVVSSGRSACPFCNLPMNITGHLCPRANGYRR